MNDVEKVSKLVGYMDTLDRCESLLQAICADKDPEDLRTWEDESLAEIEEVTRKTLAEYKKERGEFVVDGDTSCAVCGHPWSEHDGMWIGHPCMHRCDCAVYTKREE